MQIFRFLFFLFFILSPSAVFAQKLTALAPKPNWSSLNKYQQTITRDDFLKLLTGIYAPDDAWQNYFKVDATGVNVQTSANQSPFRLEFATNRESAKPLPRYWSPKRNLQGLHVALDPGHIGGQWAKIEERWFQVGNNKPVAEGDMTLYVAKLLKAQLERRGARVSLVRNSSSPATSLRPEKLVKAARASLHDLGAPITQHNIQSESKRLFYRTGEIRARAKTVNQNIKPDVVLALHFNAEAWGNESHPSFSPENHLHLLVSGCYGRDELAYEDQRYDLMVKLLNRSFGEEIAISRSVASSMAQSTGLPAYTYHSKSALNVGNSPYIWARNLLANRLYECPVIYLEPFVMNNQEVHARIQAGDYKGVKNVAGQPRKSIFREYADSVVQGLSNFYSK